MTTMNSLAQQNEMYHDYPTSPSRRAASYQTQSLNRQSSRGFDPYAQQNGVYGGDDLTTGYDDPRFNELNPAMPPSFTPFNGMQQGWNSNGFSQNNTFGGMGAGGRRGGRTGRSSLPQGWQGDMGYGGYPGRSPYMGGLPPIHQDENDSEELIPTAIVIKNIPFAVRKEQLIDIMSSYNLPLPYAFNYHFDNGVFRGLAFANFTTPEETQSVIQHMNNLPLEGRKLRVEYKKMLPQAERDRIEREKRERRGQLEEQHRPIHGSLQPSTSLSSMGLQARTPSPSNMRSPQIDMNDPLTLEYYSMILIFKNDTTRDSYDFSPELSPEHRKTVHAIAHQFGLEHHSEGQGPERFVRLTRPRQYHSGYSNRSLHRSATTDFSQSRAEPSYGNASNTRSFLHMPESQAGASSRLDAQLRSAKSHADIRNYTPSPAPSNASFPANVGNNNGSRYDYGYTQESPSSSRPDLRTPTTMGGNDQEFLANGLGGLNLNGVYGPHGSPQRLRTIVSWERQNPNPGPIGGHRAFSANLEDSNRSRAPGPARQQRGPMAPPASNFSRASQPQRNAHRTRGSDEHSSPAGLDGLAD